MKILFLIDTLEGYGAEKSIVQIAMQLEKVTPIFLHLYKGNKLKPCLELGGIKVYSFDLDSKGNFKKAVSAIIPIINKENPEIIHSTLFRSDMVARKLKHIFPHIPLIGSFVSNSYGINRYKQLSNISRIKLLSTQFMDRMTAGKVDFFVCNSHAIKNSNIRALGISSEKVKVIYRGRSFDNLKPNTKSINLLRNSLNLGNNKIFLNVGRLFKGKGQLDLVKAFYFLYKQNPKITLLIAGEGSLRYELMDLIKKFGLSNNILLLGYREDVANLLELTDFFVFPSYFEGLPGALIEAVISKTPSIVSDIAENRECIAEDGALFFQSGDVDDLRAKMEEALKLNNWKDMTDSSFEYAQKNFDIYNVSKEYEKFYFRVAGSSRFFIK